MTTNVSLGRVPLARGTHGVRAAVATATSRYPARTALRIALGLVWLLDAALQYQPFMFTKSFPQQIIAPTGPGSPGWVSGPVSFAARLLSDHIVPVNAVFATIQLAIAVLILSWRVDLVRVGLAISVVWGLGVWWMGEGLGGVLAGPVGPLMGLPGAAVVYVMLALFVWPRASDRERADDRLGGSVATRSPLGPALARVLWVALWASFAVEALRPANRSPSALSSMVSGMESGEPGWLKSIDRWGAARLAHHGTEVSIVLGVLFALLALSVLVPALLRPMIVVMVVLAAGIWTFGEAFGGIPTGQGTDPNSGPLLALFAIAFWPSVRRPQPPLPSAAAGSDAVAAPVRAPRPEAGTQPTPS